MDRETYGLGLIEYFATGEGKLTIAATGTKDEVEKEFGEYYNLGMSFKLIDDWLKLDRKTEELSCDEKVDYDLLQAFKTECPSAWRSISQKLYPAFNYRIHINFG
ncbi:hypothetical protein F7U66_01365 [Vibrio parahaemolyticus]|nr:hypothetical protein [Vibrio parahaemolyticus]